MTYALTNQQKHFGGCFGNEAKRISRNLK